MKQFLLILLCAIGLSSCSGRQIAMPTMDLPPEPVKPKIQSSVIVQNNTPWVAYTIGDSLLLYEYLLKKDSYEEKLRFRINEMNKLLR